MLEALGVVSALSLALCGLPQLFEVLKRRSASGLSWWFLGLWFGGEVGMLVYTAHYADPALWLNYGGNAVIVAVLLHFRRKS